MRRSVHVSALYIYPIKSCRGIAVKEAEITPTGFAMDRTWMLVDEQGMFISLRSEPRLCRIQPEIHHHGLCLHFLHESIQPLFIPEASPQGEPMEVTVWDDQFSAFKVSEHADHWFSKIIGRTCHLVWLGSKSARAIDQQYGKAGDTVSFADGYPYLVISEASLKDLNHRLDLVGESHIPMERFRPNIVLAGTEPYAEDQWESFRVGSSTVELVKPCTRCQVTTLDTHSGQFGKEPLKTLATYRKADKGVQFGVNAIIRGNGTISVGDQADSMALLTPR